MTTRPVRRTSRRPCLRPMPAPLEITVVVPPPGFPQFASLEPDWSAVEIDGIPVTGADPDDPDLDS